VKGTTGIKAKLKRKNFDFELIISLKKFYFSKYYKKEHGKAKVLWSIPKDREFEKYFLF
jgi:hypothetical protein